MGDVTGVGSARAANAGTCSPQDDVATVKTGETTMKQVAERLNVSESDLRKANPNIKDPNHLKAGQDVCIPEKHATYQPAGAKPTSGAPAKNTNPQSGPKIPKGRVGDYEIPLPKPMTTTEDGYDRGGTSSSKKVEQGRTDAARPRDERDLDPKVIEADRQKKLEVHKKVVDQQLQKGFDEANNKGGVDPSMEKQLRDDMIRNSGARFRPPAKK